MPGFASAIAEAGAVPVLISLVGSQVDDLAPIATLRDRGFSPDARAIVFNEASKEIGHTRDQSFGRLLTSAVVVDEVTDGAVPLWMPRLNAAAASKAAGACSAPRATA